MNVCVQLENWSFFSYCLFEMENFRRNFFKCVLFWTKFPKVKRSTKIIPIYGVINQSKQKPSSTFDFAWCKRKTDNHWQKVLCECCKSCMNHWRERNRNILRTCNWNTIYIFDVRHSVTTQHFCIYMRFYWKNIVKKTKKVINSMFI